MNQILLKVDEIIEKIKSSDDYQKYLKLQELLNKNTEIKKLISDVRNLQKRVVKGENVNRLLEEKQNLLNSNPLYREYNNTITEINNVLGIIEITLNNYFDRKLN